MDKLFKKVFIALIFSAVIFTGCNKNKVPNKLSTPAGPTSGVNSPPYTSETPAGLSSGFLNGSYSFISTAADPNDDSIAIRFDWGDGDTSDWSSYIAFEETVMVNHSWTNSGTYYVKAQAKDEEDAISNWSARHPIKISAGWIKTFGGSSDDDGYSVQQTTDGGYIITGSTQSYGSGGKDVYLIKTDASGNQQWHKTFGGSADDWANSVQQTKDGGYIIVGGTRSFGSHDHDHCQVYLIKTDANGDMTWYKTRGFDECDNWGNSVQQTLDNGYIIVGRTHDEGSEAVFLIKTDAKGNQKEKLWPINIRIRGYDDYDDYGNSVQQTRDGGYIIVGMTRKYGKGDVFLFKTNAKGKNQWSKPKHFGGKALDVGHSVQQTKDGGYIITGETQSNSAGLNDLYLIKTDVIGKEVWSKRYGGRGDDGGWSVQQTSDKGYIITGYTQMRGYYDVWLLKTNANGDTSWTKIIGGPPGAESGRSVQQTSDGGYIITGVTSSYGAGMADVYLIKTDEKGDIK